MNSLGPSVIRTLVPIIVGWLLSIPIVSQAGIDETAATGAVTAVVTFLYYVIARLLERAFPQLGFLLGYKAQPVYKPVSGPDGSA